MLQNVCALLVHFKTVKLLRERTIRSWIKKLNIKSSTYADLNIYCNSSPNTVFPFVETDKVIKMFIWK